MSPDVNVEVLTAAGAESAQRRAAGALRATGLGVGDRVAFCLPSSAALLCAVLGALRSGVVPVLVNATLTEQERDVLVAEARPGLVVTDAGALAALDLGGPVDLAPYPRARPMHYTSGTTGRSKGVWTGVWDEEVARAAFDDEADLWSFGPDDVHLVCSPMYHSVSIRFAGGTLLRGGTVVVLGRYDAEVARDALDGRFGPVPTTTFMAPSSLARLCAVTSVPPGSDRDPGPPRFPGLRLLVHAGSPCPSPVKHAAMARVGPGVVWEFYGSTEGQFTVCSPEEWLARPGTVGRARPGRALSVDPPVGAVDAADPAEGPDAAPESDSAGTIWCTPPDFARFSYWDDAGKTDAAWRDGAFTVGDLGHLDDLGYLFIDGRRDDLIISGGVNVYPAEVEAVLAGVPGVADVAVVGVPDERWGQRVCAAVVPESSGPAGGLVEAVRAHAEAHLAGYKRPKQVVVVDALPRTATGKVQRLQVPPLIASGPDTRGEDDPAGP